MSLKRVLIWIAALAIAVTLDAQSAPRRRALLIGINDYTANRFPPQIVKAPSANRDWPNLEGAVNDTLMLRELLVLRHGFAAQDIVTLTDHHATHAAILQALEQLAATAAKNDIVFFYYAGHGSQVTNSLSDEPDKLDESIVPADSRRGAEDIRDKELRRLFNRILDRGARLTILMDSCFSGSGARGLPTGATPRAVKRDLRDVRDGARYGARAEDRGAVVIGAAQDFELAWEVRDDDKQFHGAFSWAWIRAMRDAAPNESAAEVFARADARMQGEMPSQQPVIAGNVLAPFLGARDARASAHPAIGVAQIERDGTVALNGGWAHGLAIGTELVHRATKSRLRVIALDGMARSSARIVSGPRVAAGALLEIAQWAAPPGRAMRVWVPRVSADPSRIVVIANRFATAARARGVRWIADPTSVTPAHVIRWNAAPAAAAPGPFGWELLTNGDTHHLGGDAAVIAAIERMPRGSSLFAQLPAPQALLPDLAAHDGIQITTRASDADYLLTGRYHDRRLEYAWVRPLATRNGRSGLPLRSDWTTAALHDSLVRLRRIHAWHVLESPPATRSPYRLALRQRGTNVVANGRLVANATYDLVLRAISTMNATKRFTYVFALDPDGRSSLLFPTSGSVENRFPLALPAPREIPLGDRSSIEIVAPYGVDTYFLLTTDEPLANPLILEWDGIRTRDVQPQSALERLLSLTASGSRGSAPTPANWSIERIAFESVPPRTEKKSR